jgi:hypothetical protein
MYVYDRGGPHSALALRPSLIYCALNGIKVRDKKNEGGKTNERNSKGKKKKNPTIFGFQSLHIC